MAWLVGVFVIVCAQQSWAKKQQHRQITQHWLSRCCQLQWQARSFQHAACGHGAAARTLWQAAQHFWHTGLCDARVLLRPLLAAAHSKHGVLFCRMSLRKLGSVRAAA